jgi:S1-C subfamily serine protease
VSSVCVRRRLIFAATAATLVGTGVVIWGGWRCAKVSQLAHPESITLTVPTAPIVTTTVAPIVTAAPTEFDLLRRVVQVMNGDRGGAGVILKSVQMPDGAYRTYILTASHIVGDAKEVQVIDFHYMSKLYVASKTTYEARVVEVASAIDIALVEIRSDCSLGRSSQLVDYNGLHDVSLCDHIYTIGTPTLEPPSLTEGRLALISGPLLRITSPIAPGNSGGPVFLKDGRILGIITAIKGIYGSDGQRVMVFHMAVATAAPSIALWLKCAGAGFLLEDDPLMALKFELDHQPF